MDFKGRCSPLNKATTKGKKGTIYRNKCKKPYSSYKKNEPSISKLYKKKSQNKSIKKSIACTNVARLATIQRIVELNKIQELRINDDLKIQLEKLMLNSDISS